MVFFLSWSESLSKKRRNLYLISQNHRIPWAGRDPGWSLSQLLIPHRATWADLMVKELQREDWCCVPPPVHALKHPGHVLCSPSEPRGCPGCPPTSTTRPAPCSSLTFCPAPHVTSLSPTYMHCMNDSQNTYAEVPCVQIRATPAALPNPINPQA